MREPEMVGGKRDGSSPEETAARIAALMCGVMNLGAMVEDPEALREIEPAVLRSELVTLCDELTWLDGVVAKGTMSGNAWPADGMARVELLRMAAGAWDASRAIPADVAEALRAVVGAFQPLPSR